MSGHQKDVAVADVFKDNNKLVIFGSLDKC